MLQNLTKTIDPRNALARRQLGFGSVKHEVQGVFVSLVKVVAGILTGRDAGVTKGLWAIRGSRFG